MRKGQSGPPPHSDVGSTAAHRRRLLFPQRTQFDIGRGLERTVAARGAVAPGLKLRSARVAAFACRSIVIAAAAMAVCVRYGTNFKHLARPLSICTPALALVSRRASRQPYPMQRKWVSFEKFLGPKI